MGGRVFMFLTPLLILCSALGFASTGAGDDSALVAKTMEVRADAVAENFGSSIKIERLSRTLAADTAAIFKGEPAVTLGGSARNAQRIYLHGIEGSNLNITIDGARQGRNLFQHRGNMNGIDPDLLKQVEVTAGPGADSGPGALGGGIRFVTVDAQDLLKVGQNQGATLRTQYATADEAIRGSTSVYGRFGAHLGMLAHVSALNTDDYRIGGGGHAKNTATSDRDYLVKVSLLDLAGHSVRLGAELNTNHGNYNWGGSDFGYAKDSLAAVRQEMERETYTLEHRYKGDSPWLDSHVNLYANEIWLENVDDRNKVFSEEIGGSLSNTSRFTLWKTNHVFKAGFDYFEEEGSYKTNTGSITNDSDTFGAFVQDEITLGIVTLGAGARYDDYSADYGSATISGDEVSPHFSTEARLGYGWSIFGKYGEAVRGSSIIPVQWLAAVDDNVVINGGSGAKPERSRQRNAGIRYRGGALFCQDDYFDFEIGYYDIRLYDTLEVETGGRQGRPITAIYNNPETIISKGYEVRAVWGLPNMETRLTFSSFDTENSDGDPVGVIRRKVGSSGDRLVWDTHFSIFTDLTLGYTLTAVARLNDVPDDTPERAGYALHDVQLRWDISKVPGLVMTLVVNNIFDKKYSEHNSIAASGKDGEILPEPGRNVRFGLSYRF